MLHLDGAGCYQRVLGTCLMLLLLLPLLPVHTHSNEALKVIKEQAKQQQWAADKAIMAEWAAQQEKHEAARKAQVGGQGKPFSEYSSSKQRHTIELCGDSDRLAPVQARRVVSAHGLAVRRTDLAGD
jgi:hypothetical protein